MQKSYNLLDAKLIYKADWLGFDPFSNWPFTLNGLPNHAAVCSGGIGMCQW